MKLHTLKKSKGLKDKSPRIGRGNGSGRGNYSTKGLKGQKARSGHSMKPFFEGGQTSIVQRIPKAKGFKRYYKLVQEREIVNLGSLDADDRITDGMEITKGLLFELGYISDIAAFVKVLGSGDFSKKVTFVDVDKFSASAQDKVANPLKSDKKVVEKAILPSELKKVVAQQKANTKKENIAVAEEIKKVAKKTSAKDSEGKVVVKKTSAKNSEGKAPAKKTAAKK